MRYNLLFAAAAVVALWVWAIVVVRRPWLKWAIIAVPFVIPVGLVLAMYIGEQWHEHLMMQRAAPIEEQLEVFRQAHGEYPESLSEIGIVETESGPYYYRRHSHAEYELSFAIGWTVGESRTFHSTSRKWD